MDTTIQLPAGTRHTRRIIDRCDWRPRTFVERDAYGDYDYRATQIVAGPNEVSDEHVLAMNSAMRARSSRTAWARFTGRSLPELNSIPVELDLIDSPEREVDGGLAALAVLVRTMSAEKWLTDMAVSKVLFLKRPRFVAISDSYARDALGIDERRINARPETPEFYTARMLSVQQSLRELSSRNTSALNSLKAYADSIGNVVPVAGGFRGRPIPVHLSKLRILDILIWTEIAIHGPTPHQGWSLWYREAFGSE